MHFYIINAELCKNITADALSMLISPAKALEAAHFALRDAALQSNNYIKILLVLKAGGQRPVFFIK